MKKNLIQVESVLKAEAAEAFNRGMQSDYNQLAVGAAEAEKQVMAIIEEFGAARKSGFTRPDKPSAQESESTAEKVPSVGAPSNPAVVQNQSRIRQTREA